MYLSEEQSSIQEVVVSKKQVEASASRVSRFPHTPLTGPISPEKRKNTAPVQEANRNGLTKRQRFYAPKIGS